MKLDVVGATLETSVSMPYGPPPFPTVIIRTPYGISSESDQVRQWTRRGYAVVVQDVRGRFASSGRWEPFLNESADGNALVDWIQHQPWSDSNIVVYGSSYSAYCALATATARPSEVCAAIVAAPIVSIYGIARESTGAPRFYSHVRWWNQHKHSTNANPAILADFDNPDLLKTLPAARIGELVSRVDSSPIDTWRIGPRPHSPNIENYRPTHALKGTSPLPPLLVLCGVRDPLRAESVKLASTWSSHRCDLVLGAWSCDHGNGTNAQIKSPLPPRNQRRSIGEFASAWIYDVRSNPDRHRCRSVVALEGVSDWISTEESGANTETLSLRSVRRRFLAQPNNPHPSLLDSASLSTLGWRSDYAVFRTDPCIEEMDILGTPSLSVQGLTIRNGPFSELDGPVDWAFRLCAVRPSGDGQSIMSTQISSILARTGASKILKLPMLYVAQRLRKGERLEIHISAHQFPHYARGPQDGTEPLSAKALRTAHRAITGEVTLSFSQATVQRSQNPIQMLLRDP